MRILLFVLLHLICLGSARADVRLVGDWKGELDLGTRQLRFVFHVVAAPEGGLQGTFDSVDEGLFGLAIDAIEVDDSEVTFAFRALQATYEAELSEDGKALDGKWKQRGASVPLRLAHAPPEAIVKVPGQDRLVGIYEGKLDTGAFEVKLVFRVLEGAGGRLGGAMDSPDQAAFGIPIGRIDFAEGGNFTFFVSSIGATFSGRLAEDGSALDGAWKQGGAEFPVVAARVAEASKRARPQTPLPPFPYRVEDVEFENESEGVVLAGSLTLPRGEGPFACAVMITGSGPQDRDETIFEHKPFLVIADALTRRGVAVLRYDDRGVGGSTGTLATATSENLAADVSAAMDFLKAHKEIDPARIGLIGHSEGGLLAPMVAKSRGDVAFAVLLAGPGDDGAKILLEQSALIGRAAGAKEEEIAKSREQQEKIFAILKDPTIHPREAPARMKAALTAGDSELTADELAQLDAQIAEFNAPWMRFFVTYDPGPALAAMRCPTLALLGEKDLQVPAAANAKSIAAAFSAAEAAGAADLTVEVVPGVNHLFQECETGGVGEYVEIETTIDESVLARIVDFVVARTAR